MDQHILQILQEGATSVSNLLLKRYKRMALSDKEMMLIIHLLSFQQEGNLFPTLVQLEERLSMTSLELIQLLQRLLKEEYLTIDEMIDEQTGVRSERYNLEPLFRRLYHCLNDEHRATSASMDESISEVAASQHLGGVYQQFEHTFGRPLSPFEIETLQIWLEQDRYPTELVLTALREAASVGKLYIRYIDRILLEWQRQRITSVEEARNYILRFRRQSSANV
ncbi:DnaD domain-containing protein [Brevibacillus ginsengisoli]|uniref:DnaD domain-containing protein n=1 Tax=Brevibacillus ginsengisoli TaxID=363854 RepID=UPI003CEBA8E4